jgi:hypothetical protein
MLGKSNKPWKRIAVLNALRDVNEDKPLCCFVKQWNNSQNFWLYDQSWHTCVGEDGSRGSPR